ncbi:MAG: hypothetical protein KDE50_35325, partial [Caldilineaceae bacterium]|nr:hypothetical protein [Caldilineaceae bacterium]
AGSAQLSQVGAACPDHLVHTKRQPLFVDWTPTQNTDALLNTLTSAVAQFGQDYQAYFDRCSQPGDQIRDPYPRV